MGVLAIWRYPVKAMLGQRLEAARLGAAGLEGDRRFVVRDRRTGERIANKRGRMDARLRACRAELAGAPGLASLRVTLPDGTVAVADEIEDALGSLLETDVELVEATEGPAALGTPAMHHDFAPVHLVVTGTLRHLRALAPGSDSDPRRLRPNLVLDDATGAARLRRGRAGLQGAARRVRAAAADRDRHASLRGADARDRGAPCRPRAPAHGGPTPHGRARRLRGGACVGAYADVPAAGTVAVGERLEVA